MLLGGCIIRVEQHVDVWNDHRSARVREIVKNAFGIVEVDAVTHVERELR
jgi:hypothetical protein